jgi:hypothetical protein
MYRSILFLLLLATPFYSNSMERIWGVFTSFYNNTREEIDGVSETLTIDIPKKIDLDEQLIQSFRDDNLSEAARLVKVGANPNAKDIDRKMTALMYAVLKGELPLVKQLIERGADINAEEIVEDEEGNKEIRTPFKIAVAGTAYCSRHHRGERFQFFNIIIALRETEKLKEQVGNIKKVYDERVLSSKEFQSLWQQHEEQKRYVRQQRQEHARRFMSE